MPKTTIVKNVVLPRPTAPIASAPSLPTIRVSTIAIAIQPSSARTTGPASARVGLISSPIPWMIRRGVMARPPLVGRP